MSDLAFPRLIIVCALSAVRIGAAFMMCPARARALFAQVKVEAYIPVELVESVADVLKWVKSLNEAAREQQELDEIEL